MVAFLKKNKTIFTIAISLAVAVFFMWLALNGLDFEKIKDYFYNVTYSWILLSVFFGILAYWFRAVRWNLLLEPLGYKISNKNALWTISFGYLMNLTIPRSGEVARATALYGVEKVSVDQSFGTIILERIVDLLFMFIFLLLILVFNFKAIETFFEYALMNLGAKNNMNEILGFVIGGVVVMGVLFFSFKKYLMQNVLFKKLYGFIDGILQGVFSIFKLKKPFLFFIYSGSIWICYYLAAYLICFSLPQTSAFSFVDGFYIIVVGTIGMIIPASGGIGAFHFALKIGIGALFMAYGRSFDEGAEVGIAYAFISHTVQMMIMIVMGFISIPILAKAKSQKLFDNLN